MAKTLFRHPAVIVIWDDAHARNQAIEYIEEEVVQQHRPEEVITLGLAIKEDGAGISLYTESTGPDSVRGVNFIPAAMIKEVIRLGPLGRPRHVKAKARVPKPVSPVKTTSVAAPQRAEDA